MISALSSARTVRKPAGQARSHRLLKVLVAGVMPHSASLGLLAAGQQGHNQPHSANRPPSKGLPMRARWWGKGCCSMWSVGHTSQDNLCLFFILSVLLLFVHKPEIWKFKISKCRRENFRINNIKSYNRGTKSFTKTNPPQ